MTFGTYQPLTFSTKLLSADKESTSTISVVCTDIGVGGSYTIDLGDIGGSTANRKLAHSTEPGAESMQFNIFTDINRTIVWGNGSTGARMAGDIPTGNSNRSHTAYGRIPAGQSTLRAGQYTGSGTVTLTYNP